MANSAHSANTHREDRGTEVEMGGVVFLSESHSSHFSAKVLAMEPHKSLFVVDISGSCNVLEMQKQLLARQTPSCS